MEFEILSSIILALEMSDKKEIPGSEFASMVSLIFAHLKSTRNLIQNIKRPDDSIAELENEYIAKSILLSEKLNLLKSALDLEIFN